ncbi:pyridoxal phosphate-dependent aminotransferase [Candidatus Pelagibacter sp.]|nr:pyridoxal phosphate-dependent aminotransferase [Candidatus Pelagibacter sp.]
MKLSKNLERLGTESAFAILAEAKKIEATGKKMINLGIGQPDFKTPKHIMDAAKKAIDDGHHGYVVSNGILECREAVCRKIKKLYGTDINPDSIIITPGGKPTLYFAISMFGEPGSEIIYPEPGFPVYESMINYTGSKAVPYNLLDEKDQKFDPEKILSLINEKTRMLVIINPNNPTGSFVERSTIDYLAEKLKKYPNIIIFSDEIYSRQVFDDKEMPSFFNYPELRDRIIILDGWSKTYAMTGWRLGWSYWPKKCIEHIVKLITNSVSCVNVPTQYAGIAALDGPDDFINLMMKEFTYRRNLIHKLLNNLPGVECSLPGGAFYAFPNVKGTGMSGTEFAKKCMYEAGVATVPGTAFGSNAEDFVRFSFAASEDNISEALENIKKMLD